MLTVFLLVTMNALTNVLTTRVDSQKCDTLKYGNSTIYEYQVEDIKNNSTIKLSDHKGKVFLIVNVATYCTFTPHLFTYNQLQEKYDQKLLVLGFPCNQFGLQEPGMNSSEILNAMKYIRPGNNFVPNFPILIKGDVNGRNEHPIYTFLKKHCPPTRDNFEAKNQLFYDEMFPNDIRWNWVKFLVDSKGRPVQRYDRSLDPDIIKQDIEDLILLNEN